MKRDALDERKVSFKVDTEISEVEEEDNDDEPGENDLDGMSGLGKKKGSNNNQMGNSHGSKLVGGPAPGQFEEIRSGAISPY